MASTVPTAVRPPPPGGVVAHAEAAAPLSDAAGPEGIPLAPVFANIVGGELTEEVAKCEKAVAETTAQWESYQSCDQIPEHIKQVCGILEKVSSALPDQFSAGKRKVGEAFGLLDPKVFEAGVKRMKDEARSKREAAERELENVRKKLEHSDTAVSSYEGALQKLRKAVQDYVPPPVIKAVTDHFGKATANPKTFNQAMRDMMHSFLVALYEASTRRDNEQMKRACDVVERFVDRCHSKGGQTLDYMLDVFMGGDGLGGTSKDRLTPAVVSTAMILLDHAFPDTDDNDADFEAAWKSNDPRARESVAAMIKASHIKMNELVQRTRRDVQEKRKPKFFWRGKPYPNIAGIASATLFTRCPFHLPIIITFALNEAYSLV